MEVRYGDICTFIILLSIYALPLSRRFIAWATAAVVLVWTGGIVHAFLTYKSASLFWGPLGAGMGDKGLWALMNPEALSPDYFLLQILLLISFAVFLALAIGQGRRYVTERVAAEAGTALMGRFFPPSIAERLLAADLRPARRSVAVLFAQIAADRPASELVALQADFTVFERTVFAHGGIVDRFSGGPAMACFGALADEEDATQKALLCAQQLADEAGLGLTVALHWGEAVCGDFGGSHSRLFSVVGDTVNVTRRILDVARDRGLRMLASDAFVRRTPSAHSQNLGEVPLRGREGTVALWALSP
jgi:adenylate cyclase